MEDTNLTMTRAPPSQNAESTFFKTQHNIRRTYNVPSKEKRNPEKIWYRKY